MELLLLLQLKRFKKNQYNKNFSQLISLNNSKFGVTGIAVAIAGFGIMAFGLAYLSNESQAKENESNVALNPKEFIAFTLKEVFPVNHNTKIFRFALPDNKTLGLPVASCIMIKVPNGDKDGKDLARPYTPITLDSQKGYFEMMIKVYPNGIASNYIFNLKKGDKLEVKGPFAKIQYKSNMKKNIGMIAGGTGVTPMLQVIREILRNPEDKTNVKLVFANIAEEDILLKKELDELQQKHKNFKVFYVLEKPPKDWKQGVGYVTSNIIKEQLPKPDADNLILVCGPPPMMEVISGTKNMKDYSQGELKGMLKSLGYTPDQVYKM